MSVPAPSGAESLAASAPPAENGIVDVVLLAVLVALLAAALWRRRALRRRYGLTNRQRAVRLSQLWLEPVVALLVVAGVLVKDIAAGPMHLLALLVGAVLGGVLGVVRGRFLLGRVRRIDDRVVLERNWQELVVIVVLVGLQLLLREVSSESESALALTGTALLSAGIMESVARVGFVTVRTRSTTTSEQRSADAAPAHRRTT